MEYTSKINTRASSPRMDCCMCSQYALSDVACNTGTAKEKTAPVSSNVTVTTKAHSHHSRRSICRIRDGIAALGMVSGKESLSVTRGCARILRAAAEGRHFAAQVTSYDRTHPSGTAIKLVDDLGNGLSGKVNRPSGKLLA